MRGWQASYPIRRAAQKTGALRRGLFRGDRGESSEDLAKGLAMVAADAIAHGRHQREKLVFGGLGQIRP